MLSGSVALLADTIHNVADALTAIPFRIAFIVGRRPATSRYPYGFARVEDLAASRGSAGRPCTSTRTGTDRTTRARWRTTGKP